MIRGHPQTAGRDKSLVPSGDEINFFLDGRERHSRIQGFRPAHFKPRCRGVGRGAAGLPERGYALDKISLANFLAFRKSAALGRLPMAFIISANSASEALRASFT